MKFVYNSYLLLCISIPSYAMQASKPAIIAAAEAGDWPTIQILLNQGVDPNTVDPQHQANALFWAIDKGQTDIASFLIRHTNININAQNGLGSSALILACCKASQVITNALLDRNDIDVTIVNKAGHSFLDYELVSGDTDTEKLQKILKKANNDFFQKHGTRLAALAKKKGYHTIAQEIEDKIKIKLM